MAKKAKKPQPRKKFTEKRKGERQVHVIDEHSSPRDIAVAASDLRNFFLNTLDKHHGF